MFRLTPVVRNLIIINVVVFIVQKLAPLVDLGTCAQGHTDAVTAYLSMWNARTECFKPYQLFTYMFVHSREDFTHILFNMLILAFSGPVLEEFWGQKKFLLFYMVCGIGA